VYLLAVYALYVLRGRQASLGSRDRAVVLGAPRVQVRSMPGALFPTITILLLLESLASV
jgi:hypothetical protein